MPEYISKQRAGRRLGVDHRIVDRIAIAGNVRRLILPGQHVRYHAGDVERLILESTFVGAKPASELAAAK